MGFEASYYCPIVTLKFPDGAKIPIGASKAFVVGWAKFFRIVTSHLLVSFPKQLTMR